MTTYASTGERRFVRNADRACLGGVCAGIADYFGFNVCAVRTLFVISFFIFMPFVAIAYIALVLLVPAESSRYEYVVERRVCRRPRRMSRKERKRAAEEEERQARRHRRGLHAAGDLVAGPQVAHHEPRDHGLVHAERAEPAARAGEEPARAGAEGRSGRARRRFGGHGRRR